MLYSVLILDAIFDKTDRRCHLCRKTLTFKNYGQFGTRGCWEVDHSRARARGGSDRLQNLLPACISCNRSKQHRDNRGVRRAFGYSRAPVSRRVRKERVTTNVLRYGAAGALIGAVIGGRDVMLFGAALGGVFGYREEVE